MKERSGEIVLAARGLSKTYRLWRSPAARLVHALRTSVLRLAGSSGLRVTPYPGNDYREVHALAPMDIELRRGEALGVVGRNGSGKSTLLQLLCGTLEPTTGTVERHGRMAALLELGSGFNPEFTGRENVKLNAALLGIDGRELERLMPGILAFADIGDFVDQPVKTYSSGMLMRLAFSVQVAAQPDVLIVDEALGVGDEAFQRKCYRRLEELAAAGTTLLFVSHDPWLVTGLCTRAILLDGGRLIEEGAPKQVIARYHRRLYAPGGDSAVPAAPEADRVSPDSGGEPAAAGAGVLAAEDEEGYFDPALIAEERDEYADAGARIEAVQLCTCEGRPVNHLRTGKTYEVRVRARFERRCEGVYFGSMISTLKGVMVSGYNTPHRLEPIPVVEAGARLEWRYTFPCSLLVGSYTLETGLMGRRDGDDHAFLHRIVDACLFKVLPSTNHPYCALVELGQKGSVRQLETGEP